MFVFVFQWMNDKDVVGVGGGYVDVFSIVQGFSQGYVVKVYFQGVLFFYFIYYKYFQIIIMWYVENIVGVKQVILVEVVVLYQCL